MHQFTKDYYEDGIRKHMSGYEEHKWMPTRSIPEALDIKDKFDFKTCVDYGCAKGFLVHALRILGCDAYGEHIDEVNIPDVLEKFLRKSNQFFFTIPLGDNDR